MTYPRFHPACGRSPPLLDAVTGDPGSPYSFLLRCSDGSVIGRTPPPPLGRRFPSPASRGGVRGREISRGRLGSGGAFRPSQDPRSTRGLSLGGGLWKPVFVAAFDVCTIIPRFSRLSTTKICFHRFSVYDHRQIFQNKVSQQRNENGSGRDHQHVNRLTGNLANAVSDA